MRIVKAIVIFIVGILAGSCIDPFTLPRITEGSVLVVDGLFTTDPGPHMVKLSRTLSPNENFKDTPVTGATLSVKDDMGEVISMGEIGPGVYQTLPPNWRAVLGRSYTLHIQLQDGTLLESETQKIYPAGTIDSLFATYSQNSIVSVENPSLPSDAFLLLVNATGASGHPNLFRWRWKGTYEIFTRPELTQELVPGCCLVPAPLPCSGYDSSLNQIGPCTCCSCWVTEFSKQARASANQFASDNRFDGINLAKIPVDGLRFFTKYHIEVEQIGLDESSHAFWKLVQAQQAGASDIFQPNVIRIRGNIKNVTNPDIEVFGVVSFASVSRKSLVILRSEILGTKPNLPTLIMDCTTYNERSTNIKPSFW